jgi:predicted AAA+ superfamily ATPase
MELGTILSEWNAYALRRKLHARDLDLDALARTTRTKLAVLTGIRRSGKSSALMLLAQKLAASGERIAYVNVEDSRLRDRPDLLDGLVKWFGDEGYLLLDELTATRGWEGWLARTHEMLKGSLRLVVSSSRRAFARPSKDLRGRTLEFELFPLSFREFLDFRGIEVEPTTSGRGKVERALEEYLQFGGFPEVVLAPDATDKVNILNSYLRDIVGIDVAEVSGEGLTSVQTFGRSVLQSPYFSASKCLNFFKSAGYAIGKDKLLELERLTQDSYLFHFLPVLSKGVKARHLYPRKAYSGDTGFHYATNGTNEPGRLYENAVFLELRRAARGGSALHYWRDKEGRKVDLIVGGDGKVQEALQVSYQVTDERIFRRETEGLVRCAEELEPGRSTLITRSGTDARKIEGLGVREVSLVDWLLASKNTSPPSRDPP